VALVVSPAYHMHSCVWWGEACSTRVYLLCCSSCALSKNVKRVIKGELGVSGLGGVTCQVHELFGQQKIVGRTMFWSAV
jgi:hypothetical protein